MTKEQQAKAAEIAEEIRKAIPAYRAELAAKEAAAKEAAKPKAEVVPLDPWPVGRGWTPEPHMGVGPTVTIRYDLLETQRAVAAAARAARRARDPFGTGIYGHESMAEVVRRQNGGKIDE
jgi:hypothetical protein